jgi:hypothetical protein
MTTLEQLKQQHSEAENAYAHHMANPPRGIKLTSVEWQWFAREAFRLSGVRFHVHMRLVRQQQIEHAGQNAGQNADHLHANDRTRVL